MHISKQDLSKATEDRPPNTTPRHFDISTDPTKPLDLLIMICLQGKKNHFQSLSLSGDPERICQPLPPLHPGTHFLIRSPPPSPRTPCAAGPLSLGEGSYWPSLPSAPQDPDYICYQLSCWAGLPIHLCASPMA